MLGTWPPGIALGLATLGALAAATTWRTAILVTTVFAALAFGLMAVFWLSALPALPMFRALQRRWPAVGAA